MPAFRVAHVREKGEDLIIVEVAPTFGSANRTQQDQALRELQAKAASAGLAGTVCPVWDGGGGRLASRVPAQWTAFFRTISAEWFVRRVNTELRW